MDRQQEKHSGKGEQLMHTSETLHNILKTARVGFDCRRKGQVADTKVTW